MSSYNFSATFNVLNNIFSTVNINLTVQGNLITFGSGTVTYTSIFANSQLSLLPTNSYRNNDNILNNLNTSPYFTTNGAAFLDLTNNKYSFYFNLSQSRDYVSFGRLTRDTNKPLISESLSLACLLSNTNILTNEGFIKINELKENHVIICENKKHKIIRIMSTKINIIEKEMPYKLPSGILGCKEDLYLSQGHAIKIENKFFLPEYLNLKRLSIEEFLELREDKYFHIELECQEGENRRTNTLNANGVIVESYSPDEISC